MGLFSPISLVWLDLLKDRNKCAKTLNVPIKQMYCCINSRSIRLLLRRRLVVSFGNRSIDGALRVTMRVGGSRWRPIKMKRRIQTICNLRNYKFHGGWWTAENLLSGEEYNWDIPHLAATFRSNVRMWCNFSLEPTGASRCWSIEELSERKKVSREKSSLGRKTEILLLN